VGASSWSLAKSTVGTVAAAGQNLASDITSLAPSLFSERAACAAGIYIGVFTGTYLALQFAPLLYTNPSYLASAASGAYALKACAAFHLGKELTGSLLQPDYLKVTGYHPLRLAQQRLRSHERSSQQDIVVPKSKFLPQELYSNVWSVSSKMRNKLAHALNGNTSSVSRSEKILNTIAESLHMTPEATAWLTLSLDPFHDTEVQDYKGIPDSVTGSSLNPLIKRSITISCPTGITTGTWDCHVCMLPFDAIDATPLTFATVYGNQRGNLLDCNTGGSPFRRTENVCILSYPTDDNTGYANPFRAGVPSTTSRRSDYLDLPSIQADGAYRVSYQAFEVVNSTAAINAQGMCTVYRSPVPSLLTATTANVVWDEPAGTIKAVGAASVIPIDTPPQNTTEALLLNGTKQWHAREGCYVVGHMNNCDNFPLNGSYSQPLIRRQVASTIAPSDQEFWGPVPGLVSYNAGAVYCPNFRQIMWSNMDISGAFFTGLSLGTTLTINFNIRIERFPSIIQPELVTLCSPSPAYCPVAFELYKALAQHLPVGCMQKENGLGDWFRDAVATVAEVVSPVIAMVPHPAAQAISAGVAGVGKLAKRNDDNKKAIEAVTAQIENNSSPVVVANEAAAINRAAERALNKVEKSSMSRTPLPTSVKKQLAEIKARAASRASVSKSKRK
jgi:hypothetical protein